MSLAPSPLLVIKNLLIRAGCGTAVDANGAWPIYLTMMPAANKQSAAPAKAIGLYGDAGYDEGRLMSGELIEFPGVRIVVRSDDWHTGEQQAGVIAVLLDGVCRTPVAFGDSSVFIQGIRRRSTVPVPLEEEKRMFGFVIPCTISMQRRVSEKKVAGQDLNALIAIGTSPEDIKASLAAGEMVGGLLTESEEFHALVNETLPEYTPPL